MTKRSLQKLKPIRAVIIVLLLAGIFLPADMVAQTISKKYPKETLASRLLGISKDYDVNIGYRPEQCAFEIPELVLANADINQALEKSLASTGFTYEKKAEKTFVVQEKKEEPQKSKNMPTGAPGAIKGRVVEAETSEPLPGANVVLVGSLIGVSTDADGYYHFEKIPSGRYTLEVSFIGFQKTNINVQVAASKTATYDVKMSGDATALSEITVSAVRRQRSSVPHMTEKVLVQEIKALQVMASGISSEQISKSADRNAAQAVQRVSGVSIVDDKFVIVRGLNPRYNLTYLNDNVAPSTEVYNRSFALDLIPSRIIDKILVYKTASPENQADATGGVVKIYTKDAKNVKHFDIELQGGWRTGTALKKVFTYQGGKWDWLGFDDGTRKLPASVPKYGDFTKATISQQQYAQTFSPYLYLGKKTAMPNVQFTANYYDSYNLFGKRLAILSSLSYKAENQYKDIETEKGLHANTESFNTNDQTGRDNSNTQNAQLNLLQNFAYYYNDQNKIEFKNFILQQGQSTALERITELKTNPEGFKNKDIILTYSQRFLYSGNFGGTNFYNKDKHKFSWNTGYTYSRQDQPDQRVTRLKTFTDKATAIAIGDAELHWTARGMTGGSSFDPIRLGTISRIWMQNIEKVYNASADYTYRFQPWLEVSAGTFHQWKERELNRRVYIVREGDFNAGFPKSPGLMGYVDPVIVRFREQELSRVWSTEYLRDNGSGLKVFDETQGGDSYVATQQNNSGYFALKFAPFRMLEVYGGIRFEYDRQRIGAAVPASSSVAPGINVPIWVDYSKKEWLPSVNASFRPDSSWVVRTSYGRTLNRPEFREVSPFTEIDYTSNVDITGNPYLRPATVENYDFRVEFYPQKGQKGETVSVGVFYKALKNPIEQINTSIRNSSDYGRVSSITFQNATHATIKGVEVEFRKTLDFIPGALFKRLSVVANASFIKSEAVKDSIGVAKEEGEQGLDYRRVSFERPLQGQAPYIVNAGLFYENAASGTKLSVIYNTVGTRIYTAGMKNVTSSSIGGGSNYRGSLLELPRHSMDLSFTQRISKGLQMKLSVQNLLNEPVKMAEDYNYTWKYEPEIQAVQPDGTIKAEGDNIASRYYPGRYFQLSVSYSF